MLHCGGTFGMGMDTGEPVSNTDVDGRGHVGKLGAGGMLANIISTVPEVLEIADVDAQSVMNVDSCEIGPDDWIHLAKILDKNREFYHGFVVIHGTDTMVYTGAALSLLLQGFDKAIVMTGAQVPLAQPRSDARQNLLDAVTVAASGKLREVAISFGGLLHRANRAVKLASSAYNAFDSPTYARLAEIGSTVEWNDTALLIPTERYTPRFQLDKSVVRIPVVPGLCPESAFGDLSTRGVRGMVVEAFGLGNVPVNNGTRWLEWLGHMQAKGVLVYIGSQCMKGPLNTTLYKNGVGFVDVKLQSSKRMTAETAMVKLMLCLASPEIDVHSPLAGEL